MTSHDMIDLERKLRQLWTELGVTVERQHQILDEVREKALPGTKVGSFVIPERRLRKKDVGR